MGVAAQEILNGLDHQDGNQSDASNNQVNEASFKLPLSCDNLAKILQEKTVPDQTGALPLQCVPIVGILQEQEPNGIQKRGQDQG